MQPITTVHYLVLSAALLLIGTVGVLTRRNIVIILMSIELILNAVNINLIAFSHALQNINGQIFAIFVITDAVAEAAVGLGILIALVGAALMLLLGKKLDPQPISDVAVAPGVEPVYEHDHGHGPHHHGHDH